MTHSLTRRGFLASTAVATLAAADLRGAPAPGAKPAAAAAPGTQPKKLGVGVVGVGGRGWGNLMDVAKVESANVVAVCDVDVNCLVRAARAITGAETFTDYRDMLKMKGLDAVLIATPDHTHAVAIADSLKAGKHVYCEKPLTHTIRELRAVVDMAKKSGLVTQMGIQMHASENYRRVVEIIQSGAIGSVRNVHIWHNRTRRPFSADLVPPPAALNYNCWLGPQAARPFKAGFHPYSWRHWWAFGGAQLGDQACHLLDPVFWALELDYPTRISARGDAAPNEEMVCNHIVARFEFPSRGQRGPVTLQWYDNPAKPAEHGSWPLNPRLATEGIMFVGDGGMLCTNYNEYQLLPEEKFKGYQRPTTRLARSKGHHRDWVEACLKNDPAAATAPFSYGALLTETSILGLLAYRAGKELEWDPAAARFTNAPEANALLGYDYREGWTL